MIHSRQNIMPLVAIAGSAALLLGALGFQYIGGLAPCDMCIWQRYPHVVAMIAGAFALLARSRLFACIAAVACLTTAGIGLYHTGVERDWWEGPATCTAASVGDVSADELFDRIMSAPLVRCDEVAWQMMGLSMASWNAIASLLLAMLWFALARRIH